MKSWQGCNNVRFAGMLLAAVLALTAGGPAAAATYTLPHNSDVLGQIRYAVISEGDTLSALAMKHNLGYQEVMVANPDQDPWLPEPGSTIVLPSLHLLPDAPRSGIVINLSEMRLYYYAPGSGDVLTYPVGIGRESWPTPVADAVVYRKAETPRWFPPDSIREAAAARGNMLPEYFGPGPSNPLGEHAMYLDLPGYVLHGTNKPAGIGMRVSHGCIRLYPEDIEQLYSVSDPGTAVKIIDQPVKLGWRRNLLMLEVHSPVYPSTTPAPGELLQPLLEEAPGLQSVTIDRESVSRILREANGIPQIIGRRGS